jgi:hypothetical protein
MFDNLFQGTLTKLNNKTKDDVAFTQLSIKHISMSPDFLAPINSALKLENIKTLVDSPEKVKLSLSTNEKVSIEFDNETLTFSGKLVEVKLNKKEKKGEILFEYELKIEKEIEDLDKVLAVEYLNSKQENEDGKSTVILYQIEIKKVI